jgi:uncharacterized protein YggT (Ycf19 family)
MAEPSGKLTVDSREACTAAGVVSLAPRDTSPRDVPFRESTKMPVLTDTHGRIIVTTPDRRRRSARLLQFVDYLFWLLYSLLLIRLLLVFFHANSGTGFVQFIDAVTNPFYAPFRGVVASQNVNGGFTLAVPILIAMLVYGLLHLAIRKFLRVVAYRRTTL